MSDNSSVTICVRKEDEGAILEVFEDSDSREEKDGVVTLMFHDVDYGGEEYLNDLAIGVPFHGEHGRGDNYNAHLFAGAPTLGCEYVETDWDAGFPVVRVSDTGSIDDDKLNHAKNYWVIRKHVEKLFAETPAQAADPSSPQTT